MATNQTVTSEEKTKAAPRYVTERDPRQRWAWNVFHTARGATIARCDNEANAEKIADALNLLQRIAAIKSPERSFEEIRDEARELVS